MCRGNSRIARCRNCAALRAIRESPLQIGQKILVVAEAHRLGETFGKQQFEEIDRPFENARKQGLLVAAEGGKDIVGRVAMERTADADPYPGELAAAELLHEGAEAVVAGVAAPLLELDPPERDIDVVVDNDQVLEGEPVEVERRVDGAARQVHERLGLEEEQPLAPVTPLAVKAGKGLAGDRDTGPAGQ